MRNNASFALRLSTLFAAAMLLTAASPAAVQGKGAPNRVPQHPPSAPASLQPGNLETRGAFIGAPGDGQGIKRKQPATRPRADANPGSSMPALQKHVTKGSYSGTPVDGQGIRRKQPRKGGRGHANGPGSHPSH